LERQREIESKLKRDKELPEPKIYKILKRSNRILMDKFQREYWSAVVEITLSKDREVLIGLTDYIRVMERLGYAYDLNDTTSKHFECIWMHLATPNLQPEFSDEESAKVNAKKLFLFLCLMHRFTNIDNSVASIKVNLRDLESPPQEETPQDDEHP